MESPPAIGVADPISTNASASTEVCSPSNSAILRNDAEELVATPAEVFLVDPAEELPCERSENGRSDGRALDIIATIFLLVLFLPLMCLCALAVLTTSKGPLLFSQPRIGRDGRLFNCLKFRTMVDNAESSMDQILQGSPEAQAQWQAVQKLKHDPRVTPIGHFMRRYCIDELPQLFNVLRGDMSIVGPRPIVPAEQDRFGNNFAAYCSVKPGLTGIWQVSGRHSLSYQQRVELDAQYARSKCLSLDLLILWRTVPIVFMGQNE